MYYKIKEVDCVFLFFISLSMDYIKRLSKSCNHCIFIALSSRLILDVFPCSSVGRASQLWEGHGFEPRLDFIDLHNIMSKGYLRNEVLAFFILHG